MTAENTAAKVLRSLVVDGLYRDIRIEDALPDFIAAKGYDPKVVIELSRRNAFGSLLHHYYLRNRGRVPPTLYDYFGSNLQPQRRKTDAYQGFPSQNVDIHRLLSASGGNAPFIGEGAAAQVSVTRPAALPESYLRVPIAIIGYGPAGILAYRALRAQDFTNITVFENRETYGIWSQTNVVNGTRNNPRSVVISDEAELPHSPGAGKDIITFLNRIRQFGVAEPRKIGIEKITPGDLKHKIHLKDVKTEPVKEVAIVINCMGVGKPVPVSDPDRMTGPDERVPAIRWQQPSLTAEDVTGKMFVFIGLGNSTAEMIAQIHKFKNVGVDTDYRIITHYPRDAVYNPSDTVMKGNKAFRVFRDINKPNLTDYQGDMEIARNDYYRALHGNKIISDITKWDVRGKKIGTFGSKFGHAKEFGFTEGKLHALIGYRHSKESFESMGCSYDEANQSARYDYDGEFVKAPQTGGRRIYKGYFGFGAVLDSPYNRNSTVIPGMAFGLPDLMFGVVMRAGEWAHRQQSRP